MNDDPLASSKFFVVRGKRNLHIEDLHPDVTEAILFKKFGEAGPLANLRICRDRITRRSLGDAYVHFRLAADAERALNTMNFDIMKGSSIRITWAEPQHDPSVPIGYLSPVIPQPQGFHAYPQLSDSKMGSTSATKKWRSTATAAFAPTQAPCRPARGSAPVVEAKPGNPPKQAGVQKPLSESALVSTHQNDQKQMLRLFALIQEKFHNVAGKVTGMLLEMDNTEILHLLDDWELLAPRIDEVAELFMPQKQPTAQALN